MILDLMIITGGNAKQLISYLKESSSPWAIHHEEQLVLKGLLAWHMKGLAS
jgi:type III pantothenate kinase